MENRFKFRTWSFEQKRMYYWREIINMTNFGYALFVDNRALGKGLWDIQESTGLKDKNGKLIYEGDIVLINKKRKQVYFFNGAFFCKDIKQYEFNGADPAPLHYWIANEYDIEIIGNVHEIK